jgi:hypothetical protein
MLIGMTYDKLSPEGEKWIKRESKINKLRFRGGNRWDLRFNSSEDKNDAKNKGYLQGGGVYFKLFEWSKQVNCWQCEKCCKWGHQAKECGNKKRTCKYCAAVDDHMTDKCPYINTPDEHRCANCKNEIGHNAGEKMECLTYVNYYINAHIKEGLEVEQKFITLKSKLEEKRGSKGDNRISNEVLRKFDEQWGSVQEKLANQLNLNREMFSNEDIDINDYTKICDEFIDKDVMKIYKKNKKNNNKGN